MLHTICVNTICFQNELYIPHLRLSICLYCYCMPIQELLTKVEGILPKPRFSNFRKPISISEKLTATLQYLAKGTQQFFSQTNQIDILVCIPSRVMCK